MSLHRLGKDWGQIKRSQATASRETLSMATWPWREGKQGGTPWPSA